MASYPGSMSGGKMRAWTSLVTPVAFLCARSAIAQAPVAPSATQLAAFRADLKAAFLTNDGGPGTSAGGPPMMRSLVRLGFHDCASESCDGCIDPDDGNQNVGLDALIEVLTPICTTYDMSSADCFAAAASMAVEELSYEGATLAYMPLFFGREDAASCGGFTGGNPEAEFPAGVGPTFSYFADNFGFTERETVAIMGAHTLGRAEPDGSGFDGAWTIAPNAFDNVFYKDMLKPALGWKAGQSEGNNPLWQWTSDTGQQLMLNSDMALILDPFGGSTDTSGEPSCTYETCPASPTLSIAEEYAADNDLFVKEFVDVFVKMLTKGYDICDLTVVPSNDSGQQVEALYGIPAIKQSCGVSTISPAAVGPTTAGLFVDSPEGPGAAAPPVAAPVAPAPEGAASANSTTPEEDAMEPAGGLTTTEPTTAAEAPADVGTDRAVSAEPADGETVQTGTTSAAFKAAGQHTCSLMAALGLAVLFYMV